MKKYETPELEIRILNLEDIITTSGEDIEGVEI